MSWAGESAAHLVLAALLVGLEGKLSLEGPAMAAVGPWLAGTVTETLGRPKPVGSADTVGAMSLALCLRLSPATHTAGLAQATLMAHLI